MIDTNLPSFRVRALLVCALLLAVPSNVCAQQAATPPQTATAPTETAPEAGDNESEPVATTPETTSTTATPPAPTPTPTPTPEPVTTGTTQNVTDTPVVATPAAPAQDPTPAPAQEPLPWRNSFFTWTHGTTFNTLAPGAQLSYNPVYYQQLAFALRWYLSNQTFFVVQQFPYIEFTAPDDTASRWDFQLSDTLVDLRHNIAWEGFVVIPSARIGLPTSKASIAAQRYMQVGAGLTVARPFPEFAGMTIALSASYRRWIAGSNVALAQGGICSRAGDTLATTTCDASGSSSIGNDILTGLIVNVSPWSGWTFSFNGFLRWAEGMPLSTATIGTGTGAVQIPDNSPSHWRSFTSLSLGAAYDVNDWINLSLSVSNGLNWTPLWAPNGNVMSPFNPDTQVSLSASVQLDAVFVELSEHHEEEDGLTPEERQRRRQGLAQNSTRRVSF